ncbi:MAG: DUF1549 domain-containing protein, partial [Planctomycetes bacterium]|nr:DUF1549 domain-containing protein [Planctomycetota bacterium]
MRGGRNHVPRVMLLTIVLSVLTSSSICLGESLRQRIDKLAVAGKSGPQAPRSSDAEFLRRVFLDLAGTIPSSVETRRFLSDKSTGKRAKLVDRLLASRDYPRRMQELFSVMLLERRAGKTIADEKWEKYLHESFAQNKPIDQLVRELLSADGTDPGTRPAMKFFLARSASNHKSLALDVSRLFLGRNLECAQCHDHPTIKDYKQADLFGLVAYLNRSYLYRDKKTKESFFAEMGIGKPAEFTSVFTTQSGKTGPRLPGRPEIKVPVFVKGKELKAKAADGKPPLPKFPLRTRLAGDMTHPQNAAFKTNIANRLWAMMMGRGLVHPLDMHHSQNPPSHPQLLKLLADELARGKFDVKAFLRELALSETYQRSSSAGSAVSGKPIPANSFGVAQLKSLSAEQLVWSVLQATGNLKAVLATPADKKATAKYRPDKGYKIPAVNRDNVFKLFRSAFAGQAGDEVGTAGSLGEDLVLDAGGVQQPFDVIDALAFVARRVGGVETHQPLGQSDGVEVCGIGRRGGRHVRCSQRSLGRSAAIRRSGRRRSPGLGPGPSPHLSLGPAGILPPRERGVWPI